MARKGLKAGDRPVDVAIVNRVTGKKLVCELAYVGLNDSGLHEWRVDTPFSPYTEKFTVGVFPPRTTLTFSALIREEGDE